MINSDDPEFVVGEKYQDAKGVVYVRIDPQSAQAWKYDGPCVWAADDNLDHVFYEHVPTRPLTLVDQAMP